MKTQLSSILLLLALVLNSTITLAYDIVPDDDSGTYFIYCEDEDDFANYIQDGYDYLGYSREGDLEYSTGYFLPLQHSNHIIIAGEEQTDIVIPSSVTRIGYLAFYSCGNITSVTIPNSVTAIGDGAFSGCWALKKVTIPNSVTAIGDGAFGYCALESITIPNSVTTIGCEAFNECVYLTSIAIPNSVTSIGGWAFAGCFSLTSVTCEATTVPGTGTNSFELVNLGAATLNVPKSALTAYQSTSPWSEFGTIQALPKLIDSGTCGAGAEGNNLTWALYDDGNLMIEGTGAMKNYYTAVSQPWNNYLPSIKSVTIGDSVTSIGHWTFNECTGLTSVTIGNSVTEIGVRAFSGCSSLTSITIPNSVNNIRGSNAFEACVSLTSITVDAGNTIYRSEENCIIKRETNMLVVGCKTSTIPNSVTSIGNFAFSGCSGLTSITIPNSVTSIGDDAFSGCSGLTSITIPNSVTSIGDGAFEGCLGITSVTIGNSVTSIGSLAFWGCSGLTSITIPNSVTSIGNGAFQRCFGLISVSIGNSVTNIGKYAFCDCSRLNSITIPNSVISIDDYAFRDCSGLTEIHAQMTTPPTITSFVFIAVDKTTCTLIVPAGSINAYREADGWKKFVNIVAAEEENHAIETTDISSLDYAVYTTDAKVKCGKQVALTVNLKNATEATLWQAKLELPQGFTLATDEFGDPMVSISGTRTSTSRHALGANVDNETGIITLLCHSTSVQSFSGNDGEMATLVVNVADDVEAGEYPITFREVLVVEPSQAEHRVDEIVSKVTVRTFILGDLNDDERVDGIDLVGIAKIILGDPSDNNCEAADVNEDGAVDGIDYVLVVNAILGINPIERVRAKAPASRKEDDREAPALEAMQEGDNQVLLSLPLSNEYTLAQFDLTLPQGITLEGVESESVRHTASFSSLADGQYRVLVASTSNKTLGNNIVRLKLDSDSRIQSDCEMLIDNQLFVKPDAAATRPESTTAHIYMDATGINSLAQDKLVDVYNVDGKLLQTGIPANEVKIRLKKGLYIIDGKKIAVK